MGVNVTPDDLSDEQLAALTDAQREALERSAAGLLPVDPRSPLAGEPASANYVPGDDELPGQWAASDLTGGETDSELTVEPDAPASEPVFAPLPVLAPDENPLYNALSEPVAPEGLGD